MLGQYELTLNGRKVGTDLLTPGWTRYDKTCLYDTYDVTAVLHAGPNAAGLFLGNGFFHVHGGRYSKLTLSFGQLQALALLRLEYRDGSGETFLSFCGYLGPKAGRVARQNTGKRAKPVRQRRK